MDSDSLLSFGATSAAFPSSGSAYLDVRSTRPIVSFVSGSVTSVIFESVLPHTYSGNGIYVNIFWSAATATTGNCMWSAAFERDQVGVQSMDSSSFATANTVVSACSGSAGTLAKSQISFTNGQIGGVLVDEVFRLLVSRVGTNGSDTLADIAQLYKIELQEV